MAAFNYMIQAPDMGQQAWAGFERGFALNEAQRQRQMQEQQAQALAAQQAENQRIQSEFYDKIARDEAPNLADVMRYQQTLPPEQIKAMQSTFDQLPKQAQQAELSVGAQALAAIKSGQFDTAKGIFQQKADSARNGGNEQLARYFEGMVRTVDVAPNAAASSIMTQMAVVPGGKDAIESVLKVNQAPAELAKAEAEASSAATAAKFAESKAVMDLRLNDAQIKKFAADSEIARMNARIAAMNAATSREGNDLKRQELALKVQEMVDKRDETMRGKVAEVSAAQSNVDNMLNTIDRVLKNPSLNDVVGSLEGRMPEASSMLDDQESDAIALINSLGSQAFLSQLPNIKGMGQLSNAEGEKLQSALQNLSRAQSETQFKSSLKEAQRLVMKARKNIAARYGVADTVPDTPAAQPSAAEINDLIRKYGGN
jgi:hypothetical protein